MNDNKIGEQHGCIVCGKVFEVLAIYKKDGTLVDFTLTSMDGICIKGYKRPLVACASHKEEQINFALKRWEIKSIEDLDKN